MVVNTMETQPSKTIDYESLSAAMDGEIEAQSAQTWLDDDHAHQRWAQYHLIRDAMQAEAGEALRLKPHKQQQLSAQLAHTQQDPLRVNTAHRHLANQARTHAEPAPKEAANQPFFKWFALAASILGISVVFWQIQSQPSQGTDTSAAKQPATATMADTAPADTSQVVVPTAAANTQTPQAVADSEPEPVPAVIPTVQKQNTAAEPKNTVR